VTVHDPQNDQLGEIDEVKAARRLKKAEKVLDTRQLEPWERYRALDDLLDSYIDMIEIADRKARFALIVLGALNMLNLVFATRPELAGLTTMPRGIGLYAVVYIAISLFLLTRAINVLRPRAGVFIRGLHGTDALSPSARVRFIGDVVRQSEQEYFDGWQRIEVGTLNRELANHVRNLALINVEKYKALSHVYYGLLTLAFLTAFLVAAMILLRVFT
jgi:hypothetical protein